MLQDTQVVGPRVITTQHQNKAEDLESHSIGVESVFVFLTAALVILSVCWAAQ